MPKITNMHMPLIALLTLCAAAGAAGGTAYLVHEKGVELRVHEQERANTEAHREEYAALEELLAESADDRMYLQALILADQDDAVPFLSAVDRLADGLALELRAEKLEVREMKDEPFNVFAITFLLKGGEPAVIRMLTLLETLPYHSRIESAEFKRSRDELTGRIDAQSTVTLLLTIRKE